MIVRREFLHWPSVSGAVLLAGIVLAGLPLRHRVAGFSMSPGLLPGDTVATGLFPRLDVVRTPRRHERWTVRAPDGTAAVKRIAALGGETVSIVDGDLAIDGRRDLPPPRAFLERATVVGRFTADMHVNRGDGRVEVWSREDREILDDAAFVPNERRLLVPVRDVGVAIVTGDGRRDDRSRPRRIAARVGPRSVVWRCPPRGRLVLLTGRLDGHLVAAWWPLSYRRADAEARRGLLPDGHPSGWSLAAAWEEASGATAGSMAVSIDRDPEGLATSNESIGTGIDEILVWRDVVFRSPADGTESWRLHDDEFFVLGDFPSGSIDSRHWGPLPRGAIRHRIDRSRSWHDGWPSPRHAPPNR